MSWSEALLAECHNEGGGMSNIQGPGCGVRGHSDECLCDVVIVTPTPINADAVQNMWMKQELCNMKNYSQPWTDTKLVSFFEDLVYAHDSWVMVEYVRNYCGNSDYEQNSRWQVIRQVLRLYLAQQPMPMIADFMAMFGLSSEELTEMMTSGKRRISWETLELLEQMIRGQKHTLVQIERATGLSQNSVRTLYKYWFSSAPPVATASGLPRGFVSQEARRLSREGLTPTQVSDKLKQDHGIILCPSDVVRANKLKQKT